eukprot:TRINITY_DN4882_c0_g1_i3.p1 TRINITY_DN4882_c0_g1~~TRINITY_DN4882_c0_g1_i3.p1  ORF type:complete len:373 (-),score=50.59 TRINITY_DN4882_c0_g1_i3:42-1160(-)
MNYEAFECLTDRHNLLNYLDGLDFVSSLELDEESGWLRDLYESKLKKFEVSESGKVLEKLEKLSERGLKDDIDICTAIAEVHYYKNDFQSSFNISNKWMTIDPFLQGNMLIIHISSMVELGKKNELFYLAHKLTENFPTAPFSHYAVGCYYLLIGKLELARTNFRRCTSADDKFSFGWIGFGHSLAREQQDKSSDNDQAISAYRSASRIMPDSHIPQLCIGIELMRMGNLELAYQNIIKAQEFCPGDPLSYNEQGVILYRSKRYSDASTCFQKVISLCGEEMSEMWETTMFNLGNCHRKMKQYEEAIKTYNACLAVSPTRSSTHSMLGLTYQLMDKFDQAIEQYHIALSADQGDPFAVMMLNRCLESMVFSQ